MYKTLNVLENRFWLESEIHKSNAVNLGYLFKINGYINESALKDSIFHIIKENKILHSVVKLDKDYKAYLEEINNINIPFTIKKLEEANINVEKLVYSHTTENIDLRTNYPVKFILFNIDSTHHYFLFITHHIIADPDSIILGEPLKTINYEDDILEFNKYINDRYEKQIINNSGLLKHLEKINFHTALPSFISSSDDKYYYSINHYFSLGEKVYKQINDYCDKYKTTAFRFLTAAWCITLSKLIENDNIVMDHPVDLRPKHLKNHIGCCLNNLPLVININSELSFKEVIQSVKNSRDIIKQSDCIDYQYIISVLRNQKGDVNISSPNVSISYPEKFNGLNFKLFDTECQIINSPYVNSQADLVLLIKDDIMMSSTIIYSSKFPSFFISEIENLLKLVISQAINNPEELIKNYRLVSKDREDEIIISNRVSEFKPGKNIIELLNEFANKHPLKKAVICDNISLSFNDLNKISDNIAQNILHTLKNSSDKINKNIGLFTSRNINSIPTILGIMKAGYTYIPIDISTPIERIKYIINDCHMSLIISDLDSISNINFGTQVINQEDLLVNQENTLMTDEYSINNTAYIIYTSGTTGNPKGVEIRYANLMQMIETGVQEWDIDSNTVALQMASLSFDASIVDIFPTLFSGGTVVFANDLERKNISSLIKLIRKYDVSFATLPPALLGLMPVEAFPKLKTLIFAGESTPKETFNKWAAPGRRLINGYGPTENTVCATCCDIHAQTPANNIGKAVNNVSAYILDKNMHILPYGFPGELHIGGNQLSNGYHNRKELNAEKFVNNPYASSESSTNKILYKSGDKVYLNPDKDIIYLGRTDFQVKINSFRIELPEIETKISLYPGVEHCIVLVSEKNGIKQLAAYIQANNTDIFKLDELKVLLEKQLPPYMLPKLWYISDKLPLNINGKIDRKAILNLPLTSTDNKSKEYIAPKSNTEVLLANIISKIIKNNTNEDVLISINDNIFDLGINSLDVMLIAYNAINMGLKISAASIYSNKAIEKIAAEQGNTICYWGNEYSSEKPILLFFCGYPYFTPFFNQFKKQLSDYSIIVMESYNELLYRKEDCSIDNLLEIYLRNLEEILPHDINSINILGYCLGGEIAIRFASKFTETKRLSINNLYFNNSIITIPL